MVKAYKIEEEFAEVKRTGKSKKGFLLSTLILFLLASAAWGLALKAEWRELIYSSLKPAPAPVEVKKEEKYVSPDRLTITYLDVGQGLSHVIQIPSGKVIMYDAGKGGSASYSSRKKNGPRAFFPFLMKEHIKRIDVITLSSPELDHLGGFIPLLQNERFEIGECLGAGSSHPTRAYEHFLRLIKKREISYRVVREGDILDWGPDVFVQVLSPPRGRLYDVSNDNSVVLKLVYGQTSFLFTGDIEHEAIEALIANYGPRIKADVVQVPHHGSKTSHDRDFIGLAGASYAVTSASGGPPFGHPHPEVVKRWQEAGTRVYHTHLSGNITITSDGKKIEVRTAK